MAISIARIYILFDAIYKKQNLYVIENFKSAFDFEFMTSVLLIGFEGKKFTNNNNNNKKTQLITKNKK
ncbi:hypothetical protein BLA29_006211 [Euroglyphus maynei]|uniref:Uncharacterized protein n=1 Tax=Euroglyphus maynei TaxID=6958 RepID=A0A1Y3BEI4_EURMA|nr:hypothetical protein BLA29_006211 [Euroglyphus maynei]